MLSKSWIRMATAAAAIVLGLVVMPATGRAAAIGPVDCQVTQVRYARNPGELRIYCGFDGTYYQIFASGNSGMIKCMADLGAIRAMEANALAMKSMAGYVKLSYSVTVCNGASYNVLINVDTQ